MAKTLAQVTEGQLVKLAENGVLTEFYVAKHDYESGLNGPGRTLLVRKDVKQSGVWNSTNVNAYAGSTIDKWFNTTYLQTLDEEIKFAAGKTKFYYTPGNGDSKITTLERTVFALSLNEFGVTSQYSNSEGTTLSISAQLKIAYLQNEPFGQFTRTPQNTNITSVNTLTKTGEWANAISGSTANGYRPCLTLPSTLTVDENNTVQSTSLLLRSVPEGSLVKLNESGAPVNYIVVHQGKPGDMYDDSCDGTWVLRQDIKETGVWNSTNVNTLPNSTIMQTMAGYLNLFDIWIQATIKTVKIPYCVGGESSTVKSGADGLECKVFPLCGYEVGFTSSNNPGFPKDGEKLSYFTAGIGESAKSKRISNFQNSPSKHWIRSQYTTDSPFVFYIDSDGGFLYSGPNPGNTIGLRPAMVLPQNLIVLPDGTLSLGSTITVPALIMQGNEVPVSWTAIDGADSYTLQRKADAGEWEQIYSGSETNFTDTAGDWKTVQYQVQAVFDGVPGAWSQSDVVEVVSKSAVAISGQDGDLGTIISDIGYSVSTDTGKKISLTRTVNGVLVARLEVDSGFAYSIPVLDLPTGTGTIVITATVQTDSDPVTVTRTWTYTKAAQTFPGSGGVAQLTQDGQEIFPMTLAEAVKPIGGPWGANLGTALDKLALAAVYNRTSTPKYTEVKVDLSKAKAGDIVNLPENGVMTPFYVASLNYEPTLNTSGTRVLMVRKDVYQNGQWNASNVNTYANSTIDTWFNSTYKPMLDGKVLAEIGETTFYYTPGNGSNEVTTLARAVFAVSLTELGLSRDDVNTEGETLPVSSSLKTGINQWTRSSSNAATNLAITVGKGSEVGANFANNASYGYRPCFTLPLTFSATFYVDTNGTVHPEQEYTQGGSFADLFGNIIPTVRIETGSYVGTGTYGSGNPNKLAFRERPKLVFISDFGSFTHMVYIDNQKEQDRFSVNGIIFSLSGTPTILKMYVLMSENEFQWYSDSSASNQLNQSGHEYSYTEIY